MVLIFIVRHAQTDNNVKRLLYDNYIPEHDISINNVGINQALITGKYLNKYGPFDAIYSSTRNRTIETAKIIAKECKYKKNIKQTELLLERKPGDFHGIKNEEVNKILYGNSKIDELYKKKKV